MLKLYAVALCAVNSTNLRFVPASILAENDIVAQGIATQLAYTHFPQVQGWGNQQAIIMQVPIVHIQKAFEDLS